MHHLSPHPRRDPLSCDDARELLSAALDGELEAAEEAALEVHLAACADCAAHRGRLAGVRDVFRSLPPAEPPRDLASAVMERIRAGEAGEPPAGAGALPRSILPARSRGRRWAARVAAALLLVGAGAGVLWHGRASDAVAPAAADAQRIASPALEDLGLDAGCGDGADCLQLGPCDSAADCGGGAPCSVPGECGGTFR